MPRHQLPARSPLTARGLLAGLRGARRAPLDRLRARLEARFSASRAILTGSGTQALTLAIRAAAPSERAPLVALPAYACFDLVSAAVGADARIVFYDVDMSTLSPDTTSLAQACARRPDAVVVAPLYGLPVGWEAVRKIVATCDAVLIEDAAQSVGATWQGRALGSLGDLSVISFGRGKGWTGGAGGALLARRGPPAHDGTLGVPPSNLGVALRTAAQWILGRPGIYWVPAGIPWLRLGETPYHPPREPERIPALAAALVLEHEDAAQAECDVRRQNAEALLSGLAGLDPPGQIRPMSPPAESRPGYLRLPLLTSHGMEGFPDPKRARALGVMPGYPDPLPELPAARPRTMPGPPTPGATRLARDLITLPTHGGLAARDRSSILEALASYRSGSGA